MPLCSREPVAEEGAAEQETIGATLRAEDLSSTPALCAQTLHQRLVTAAIASTNSVTGSQEDLKERILSGQQLTV